MFEGPLWLDGGYESTGEGPVLRIHEFVGDLLNTTGES